MCKDKIMKITLQKSLTLLTVVGDTIALPVINFLASFALTSPEGSAALLGDFDVSLFFIFQRRKFQLNVKQI